MNLAAIRKEDIIKKLNNLSFCKNSLDKKIPFNLRKDFTEAVLKKGVEEFKKNPNYEYVEDLLSFIWLISTKDLSYSKYSLDLIFLAEGLNKYKAVFELDLNEMPLLINDSNILFKLIAEWRLRSRI